MDGPFIGHGYVAGIGQVAIFSTDKPQFLRVQNKSGIRYFVARGRVQFRKTTKEVAA